MDQLSHYTIDYRGKTPPTSTTGIPIISAANVKGGRVVFDNPRFISEETYKKHCVRGFAVAGDLVVTTEAPVAEVALYPSGGPYQLTRRVIGFQTAHVENAYVACAFKGAAAERHLKHHIRGTTVPRILKPALQETPVALPPVGEQRRIVSEIERLFSVGVAAEGAAGANAFRAHRLRQSILKWAFAGKLVDQDSNDEPAANLLARIQAERDAAQATAKKNGRPARRKRKKAKA